MKRENYIRKITSLLLIGVMIVSTLTGCSMQRAKEDQNTIRISVASQTADDLMDALVEKFPDINFEFDFYSGSGTSYYMMDRLTHHDAGDIIYYTTKMEDETAKEYLLDLSKYNFIGNYDSSIIRNLDVDGSIYQVPGPIVPRFIIFNKTLFEENNWKIPTNFNELVEVCTQIREDQPEITPIGIGMASMGWLFGSCITFSQAGYLSSPEGQKTNKQFVKGECSMRDALGEGLTQMAQLIDCGAFGTTQFTEEWDFSPKSMGDRHAAMYIVMRNTQNASPLLKGTTDKETYGEYCTDEFGALPFYGIHDGDEAVGMTAVTVWGLNKELGEKGNEKKLKNAVRVMEYMSSNEGQQLMISAEGQISSSKESTIPEEYQELWKLKENGQAPIYLYYGYDNLHTEVGTILYDAVVRGSSEGMIDEAVRVGDEIVTSPEKSLVSYGTAIEDFTEAQTVQLGRETLLAGGFGDFVLTTTDGEINRVVNKGGYTGKIYEGNITEFVARIVCGYIYNTAVTIPMTGAEVKELLNNGKTIKDDLTGNTATFEYGWAGIDVKLTKDGKVSSVKFNGEELSDADTYQVVFTSGDYTDEFAASHEITSESEKNIMEIFLDYTSKNNSISAPEATR